MKKFRTAARFKRSEVIMKKAIPVFHGFAASGSLQSGVQFSIVCPDADSCEEIWQLVTPIPLDRKGLQKIVMARKKDIEMEVVKEAPK